MAIGKKGSGNKGYRPGLLLAVYVNSNRLWFTAFAGVNLLQFPIAKWCLVEGLLKKFGVKD